MYKELWNFMHTLFVYLVPMLFTPVFIHQHSHTILSFEVLELTFLRFFLMVFDLLVVIDLQIFGKRILYVMEGKSDNATRYFKGE